MTLHEAMPDYDVREYHQTVINASREEVYRTMKTMDFRASEIVRALLWIRSGGREAEAVTLETCLEAWISLAIRRSQQRSTS